MAIPKEILDDLCSRFLISLPPEEREDPVRVCFQAERAHWFYLDNLSYYEKTSVCPKCNVRDFIRQIFKHCSFLQPHAKHVDEILEKWKEYKGEIPTHGAILIDESLEHVLLVQGYHAKASWGFPKGKCNEEEQPHQCAIREVKEETGFDISPLLNQTEYIERHVFETTNRLYIVAGVPRDYAFKPTTRNEIKQCRWFSLDALPISKTDNTKSDLGIYPNNFFMVFPYVEQLKKWVATRRLGASRNGNRGHGGACASAIPVNANGNLHRHDDHRPNRHQQGQRIRSVSYTATSSYNYGNNGHPGQLGLDKGQQRSPVVKQQTNLKKNKKTPTKQQKPNSGGISGEGTSSGTTSAEEVFSKLGIWLNGDRPQSHQPPATKLDIQPARAWQEFTFNWETIFSAM